VTDAVPQPDSNEPVPKLPRGRGLKLSGPELFRIAITLAMLIAVIALTRPCARSVSSFVMGFDGSAKGSAMPKPGTVDVPKPPAGSDQYEALRPGMTDEEVKAAIERAKAKAAAGSATP
jgi:hypothetical protein